MKRSRWLIALCLISSPAAQADEQQNLKEYGDALRIFGAGQVAIGDYFAAAPKQVLDGIDGRWGPLSQMGVRDPKTDSLELACRNSAWTISAKNSFGFTMVREGVGKSYSVTYASSAGNGFVFTTDLAQKLNFGGLDKSDSSLDYARFAAIKSGSGLAMVYRPSANALVVQSFDTPPAIYIRCH